jgi:hypothetical protein
MISHHIILTWQINLTSGCHVSLFQVDKGCVGLSYIYLYRLLPFNFFRVWFLLLKELLRKKLEKQCYKFRTMDYFSFD